MKLALAACALTLIACGPPCDFTALYETCVQTNGLAVNPALVDKAIAYVAAEDTAQLEGGCLEYVRDHDPARDVYVCWDVTWSPDADTLFDNTVTTYRKATEHLR